LRVIYFGEYSSATLAVRVMVYGRSCNAEINFFCNEQMRRPAGAMTRQPGKAPPLASDRSVACLQVVSITEWMVHTAPPGTDDTRTDTNSVSNTPGLVLFQFG
jgi:hypothetical protein